MDKIKINKCTKFCKNWLVRVYNRNFLIDSWRIENRYEWEAQSEAEAEIKLIKKCDDWTMTPLK